MINFNWTMFGIVPAQFPRTIQRECSRNGYLNVMTQIGEIHLNNLYTEFIYDYATLEYLIMQSGKLFFVNMQMYSDIEISPMALYKTVLILIVIISPLNE